MQGKKHFSPKLFYQTSLDSLVPKDNFYRLLHSELDMHYLYSATIFKYSREGQECINTKGNKHILMAARFYNLNKYLKFTAKKVKDIAIAMLLPQGENYVHSFSVTWSSISLH